MPFPIWAVVALVGAEYALFSAAFDSGELLRRHDEWAIAGYLGSFGVFVAAAVAGVILVLQANPPGFSLLLIARPLDRYVFGALAAHAGSVAFLWWLTSRILSSSGPPAGPASGWLALWFVTALATPLLAAAAAVPMDRIRGAFLASWPALLGGSVIGAGAWVVGQSSALLWQPLGPWTLEAVEWSLNLLLDNTYYDQSLSVIGSDSFRVRIHRPCSGFEGVGLMTVFVAAYLLLARGQLRFPHALLLLPLGIAAWVAANVARIVALILIGTSVSPSVAAGGFHARAGWVLFSAMALTLVLLSRRLQFFAHEPSTSTLDHPTAAYLLPFLALVAVALLAGLASTSLDLLYGLRIVAAVVAVLMFRHFYQTGIATWSWSAVFAGLLAAAAFIVLTPVPEADSMRAWSAEWLALPAWARLSWTLVRVLGSILIVPLVEELAFRGYLLRRLVAREFETVSYGHFSFWALLISSIAFGVIHTGWLGGTVAGLLFGLVQMRGNSLAHAILAHIVSNLAIAGYVLAFDQWWLWM